MTPSVSRDVNSRTIDLRRQDFMARHPDEAWLAALHERMSPRTALAVLGRCPFSCVAANHGGLPGAFSWGKRNMNSEIEARVRTRAVPHLGKRSIARRQYGEALGGSAPADRSRGRRRARRRGAERRSVDGTGARQPARSRGAVAGSTWRKRAGESGCARYFSPGTIASMPVRLAIAASFRLQTGVAMNKDQRRGLAEEIKGYVSKGLHVDSVPSQSHTAAAHSMASRPAFNVGSRVGAYFGEWLLGSRLSCFSAFAFA